MSDESDLEKYRQMKTPEQKKRPGPIPEPTKHSSLSKPSGTARNLISPALESDQPPGEGEHKQPELKYNETIKDDVSMSTFNGGATMFGTS